MKIAVINGSPKGKYSITLQTVLYLEKKFPKHEFSVLNAGQQIKSLEKNFDKAKALLENSDAVIFSYPVYTFFAPSQLHRFIELMKSAQVNVSGKYVTQVSTSKHFYDITAHKYIEENALDMGMRYIRGLSADMEDLLEEKGREDAEKFFERFLWAVNEEIYTSAPVKTNTYLPVAPSDAPENGNKKDGKDIIILTDETNSDSNLSKMISRFRNVFGFKTRIVNISEFPLAGGCLGCFRCAVSEKCVYKDGFDSFLRENIQKADAIVYAFTVTDHSMGSRFKMYDDRNFCNGHRTVTVGMPVGYLVSGNYSEENNLRNVIEARSETGGNFLAGVATDEYDTDKQIDTLAKSLAFALETKHTAPANFWGVGGMKIFRDLIYQMRGMMRADHKFYKKQGIYDFPHKNKGKSMLMYAVGALLSSEKILSKMGNKMNEGMLMPYEQILKKLDNEKK
ncbi:MAG: NAD(P)H-dependent oxidoreductase [Acutalibacteraceae bacterium]|nr:NAD(P)H-dependent oxidoreductase [Acutalibacteraceae bacterium]